MINALLLPLALALAATPLSPSRADDRPSPTTQTARTETVRTDQANLFRSDIARAQAWGLSQTEWRRYQTLMQGIRGSVSPDTISPFEVLGIHARDEAERRRYAELWAQAMWEDAERILGFQRAYVEASRRLYPDVPLIDSSRLPEKEEETTGLEPQDRVLLFTRPDCDACDAMLARLLGRIDQIAGIDIYLADIDGLMQVNWRWHRDKLGDPWQALDPEHNLQVGARILATCYQERRDRWDAVGCYHAPNNRKFASRYHRNVAAHWRRITQRG